MSIPSIAFTLPDLHAGFTEMEGAVYLDAEFIVLNMNLPTLGGLRKKERIIKIEPRALSSVSLLRGLAVDKICLRPKKEDLLDAIPGKHLGEVQLRVWRTRRLDSKLFVQEVRRRMAMADALEADNPITDEGSL
ncbi:MAG: hypothetical protein ACI80V_001644 [Rhodothermales bacterium]